jgi:hypothetical protein
MHHLLQLSFHLRFHASRCISFPEIGIVAFPSTSQMSSPNTDLPTGSSSDDTHHIAADEISSPARKAPAYQAVLKNVSESEEDQIEIETG